MKKGYLYTVLFMVVLSAIFTFALAASYEAFKPSIRQNELLQEERAILYAFDLDKGLSDGEVSRPMPGPSGKESLTARLFTMRTRVRSRAMALPVEGSASGAPSGLPGGQPGAKPGDRPGLHLPERNPGPGRAH